MHSLGYRVFVIVSFLAGLALALPVALHDMNVIRSPTAKDTRSTNTCADPSLAHTYFQAYDSHAIGHQLNFLHEFESYNSASGVLFFTNEHPAFNAWMTQQDFTFPLFVLSSPTGFTYALGANAASPPVISGYFNLGVIAWVYSSQVCGSVPLMSATLAAASDNYYTIDPFTHAGLISDGYTDTGVIAFVLPLSNS